jgi:hypothetical protein
MVTEQRSPKRTVLCRLRARHRFKYTRNNPNTPALARFRWRVPGLYSPQAGRGETTQVADVQTSGYTRDGRSGLSDGDHDDDDDDDADDADDHDDDDAADYPDGGYGYAADESSAFACGLRLRAPLALPFLAKRRRPWTLLGRPSSCRPALTDRHSARSQSQISFIVVTADQFASFIMDPKHQQAPSVYHKLAKLAWVFMTAR